MRQVYVNGTRSNQFIIYQIVVVAVAVVKADMEYSRIIELLWNI